jgi:hypothetical protein
MNEHLMRRAEEVRRVKRHRWNPLLVLVVALASSLALGSVERAQAYSSLSISVSYFYDTLGPYGHWIDYPQYGRCWVPASYGWRPYTDGYWVYSDYGWTWVDYEPWGWAVSHYGNWVFDPIYGWVWVPGTVWAPAWVAWHYNDDWVGWAPLPPTFGGPSFAFSYSTVVVEQIPAHDWCFVPSNGLFDRRLSFVARDRNVTLLAQTRNATRFGHRDGHTVNEGIDVRAFERSTGRNVRRFSTVNASSPRGGNEWVGDRLALYRPTVRRDASLRDRALSSRDREWAQTRSAERGRPERNRAGDFLGSDRPGRNRAGDVLRSDRSARSEGRLVNDRERTSRTERNLGIERGWGRERGATFERRSRIESRPERSGPTAQTFEERNTLRSPLRERPQVERGRSGGPRAERRSEQPQVERGRRERSGDEERPADEESQDDRRDSRDRGNGHGQGHERGRHSG